MAGGLFRDFLTNLDQPMPLGEKIYKVTRSLWRRVLLRAPRRTGLLTG